ncbi:hypothetical protein ACTXT7_004005 [Hymenolepis weldensis]
MDDLNRSTPTNMYSNNSSLKVGNANCEKRDNGVDSQTVNHASSVGNLTESSPSVPVTSSRFRDNSSIFHNSENLVPYTSLFLSQEIAFFLLSIDHLFSTLQLNSFHKNGKWCKQAYIFVLMSPMRLYIRTHLPVSIVH